jgi:hypothetical protein
LNNSISVISFLLFIRESSDRIPEVDLPELDLLGYHRSAGAWIVTDCMQREFAQPDSGLVTTARELVAESDLRSLATEKGCVIVRHDALAFRAIDRR